jgi:hypothetical protein
MRPHSASGTARRRNLQEKFEVNVQSQTLVEEQHREKHQLHMTDTKYV